MTKQYGSIALLTPADKEWQEEKMREFRAFLDRSRSEFITRHLGSDQHTWERWDCGCTWGCEACSYDAKCSICGTVGLSTQRMTWDMSSKPLPKTIAEQALLAKKVSNKFGRNYNTRTLSHKDRTVEILGPNNVVLGVAKRMKKGYWNILEVRQLQ